MLEILSDRSDVFPSLSLPGRNSVINRVDWLVERSSGG